MKKKLVAVISIAAMLVAMVPSMVFATGGNIVEVGNETELRQAIENATTGVTIKITGDIALASGVAIENGKDITIDLNNHNITAPNSVFSIKGAKVNFTGTGTIRETEPYYGAFVLRGSITETDKDYTVLTIGENVTAEGWAPVFINTNKDSSEVSHAYGINVDVYGKLNSVKDTGGDAGSAIYINGLNQDKNNHPIITIRNNAELISEGVGIYAAGYAQWNVYGSVTGIESGIGIKSGKLNVYDGASITCTGPADTPEGYSNGINASGAAIQIESNNGYAGDIELNIAGGTIESKNGYAIYEYANLREETPDECAVKNCDISNGRFEGGICISEALAQNNPAIFEITGGTFDSDVSEYLAEKYVHMIYNVGIFEVLEESVAEMEAVCEYQGEDAKYYAKDKEMLKKSLGLSDEAAGEIETTGYYVTFFNMTPQGEIDEENPYQVIVHGEGTIQDALDQRTEMYDDTLQAKEYEGYKFVGWYELDDNKNFTNKVNFGKTVNQNVEYYSAYEKVTAAKADAPKTGDDSNMMLPIAIALIALAGIATVLVTRRKHN